MAHTYNVDTGAWIQDETDGWISSKVLSKEINGEKATLVFEITAGEREGEKVERTTTVAALEGTIEDKNLPPLMNPPILEASDDLTSLSHLNEPAVLQAIKLRYAKREIYTYSGIVLIAANPFDRMDYLYDPGLVQAYAGKRKEDQDPHLFAIADTAYQAMVRDQKNQTIVVSGESGAGKTVSAKYIMRYFATVEDPTRPGRRKKNAAGAAMSKTEEQILATNPIMEAFGNAKTTRNDNSSRFGKYIEILFDKEVDIIGAKIRTYLLERARLVFQPATERNYHIFYQLIAGCSDAERAELGLKPVEEFFFTNQGGDATVPNVDDAAEFKLTREALTTIGVPEETQSNIWKVLAALLHLGNTEIGAVRNGSVLAPDEPNLVLAADLLGVKADEFAKWTTKKQLVMRNEKTVTPLSQKQAMVVRDSIAKFVYSALFDWLVEITNDSLAAEEIRANVHSFIGVLDIYGFEHFKKNSFEQFCINYANEKLQQEFNQHVFKLEQEEYAREQINWQYIEFSDNRPCIDLIEGKLGILSLLDEESRLPAGSDESLITKLNQGFENKGKDFPYQKARFGKSSFTVCHYAVDVTYDSEGFVEKNRDTVPDEHLELLKAATNPFLTTVLQASATARDKETGQVSKTAVPPPGRKLALQSTRKPTLGGIFKTSLIELMNTIGSTNVHYIRCIKPNEAKVAWKFEGPMVLSQLQACGVLETVKISCAGYPTRWTYEEFASRYYMLIHSDELRAGSIRDVGLKILQKCVPAEGHPRENQRDGKDKYQLGMSKIFFRAGMLAFLENLRTGRLNSCAILIQKNLRAKFYRKKYLEAREAILKSQALARGYLARKAAQELRVVKAATTIQRVWRGSKQREAYHQIRNNVVTVQAYAKGYLCRKNINDHIMGNAARYIQKAWRSRRFLASWNLYRKRVVYLQSIWRGKVARRAYKTMREEARDLKQISYKLENKVVELTQAVGMLKKDNKALLEKVESFDNQVKSWRQKHANLENRNKELQLEANQAGIAAARLAQMDEEMKSLQAQFDESTANMKRLQEEGNSLRKSLTQRTSELDQLKVREKEHEDEKLSLRQQIQSLEDQLQHASIREEELAKGEQSTGGITNGLINFVTNKKPKRRSAEIVARPEHDGMYRSSYQTRPVSMMPTSQPVRPREFEFAAPIENSEYELLRILEEEEILSDEVSIGLIRNLKVPPLNSQTPLQYKEVLFPAYLINVVTSEMWNNGFVKESERFLANVMQSIQNEVMSNHDEDSITQGAFWLSNVHEMLSFVFLAEDWYELQKKDNFEYDRLLDIVKHDLESLEFNIYHTWMKVLKRKLHKMIIPAIIESQSLPGFVTNDGNRFLNKILQTNNQPQFSMDDLLSLLNKVYKAMKTYFVEESIITQAVTELLKLVGVTAFNDLLLRRNFLSWKRGLQINYNITRIEEWCKSNDMPEGILQLEHLMQATKLLQLKKATLSDIEIIQDICWMLSPNQIQKLLNQYLVADYEQPINGEIMKAVASRVTEKSSDVLLLPAVDMDDSGPYEIPEPRQIGALETYCPSYLQTPKLRRLADVVAAQAQQRAAEALLEEQAAGSPIDGPDTILEEGEEIEA
ncbi:P-loop containing nucleoside triphosphate hydrolase protein [Pyronema domesticum]|uniref:Similar to Myosin-2 acc. no. Q875Q8 n=1 Tax=Pyronema omphalodes (strain CBS 100304) TaxID=1076935 RepID=U4L4M4_PYROM|nr:P-loop containing nucleoside triphosphate hydrolase protein [Pyronema domesticum]CCX12012.1 Similar to Myosin-2; acc. no. Q875Q8 [Pyronema omphalodes CBS 100304]